nr:FAD-dependent oxidoreductase [Nocardioides thalensis]
MVPERADLVVLGGGSAGYAAALRGRQLGLEVVLVEEDLLGGTCLHRGCIPTKSLLHVAEVADQVREAAALGLVATVDGVGGVDGSALRAHRERVVGRLHRGLQALIAASGAVVVPGRGKLVAPGAVGVGDRTITAGNVLIATGAEPIVPAGVTLGDRIVTSDGALELPEVPGRAVIVGGNVIGLEIGSAWRSLGADVTVVEARERVLPDTDAALGAAVRRAFRRRGMVVRTGVAVTGVEASPTSAVVSLGDDTTLDADVVLVAVGRRPRTSALGLAEAGVRLLDSGHVATDERLATSAPGVFAGGDLVVGPQLAHRGFAHGVFVAEEIAGLAPMPVDDALVPRVTYGSPEVVSVGLTEDETRTAHGSATATTYDLAGNGRSLILGTSGHAVIVTRPDGQIAGVHLVGDRVSEQAGAALLMVAWESHAADVAVLPHAHPTQSEALGEAAMVLAGRPLHAHS